MIIEIERKASGSAEIDLSNLVLLDSRPPHALYYLAAHLVAAKAVLPVLLPLAAPLPAVAEKVSALALPHSVGELPGIPLACLPLHLCLALQHAPAPRSPHVPAVVQHQDAFPVELVVLE